MLNIFVDNVDIVKVIHRRKEEVAEIVREKLNDLKI